MVEMKVDIFEPKEEQRGVGTIIKGPAFAIRAELRALLHTVFMNYAHVSEISYDAAKMEMMCKLAEVESNVKYSQEEADREYRESAVELSEDE